VKSENAGQISVKLTIEVFLYKESFSNSAPAVYNDKFRPPGIVIVGQLFYFCFSANYGHNFSSSPE